MSVRKVEVIGVVSLRDVVSNSPEDIGFIKSTEFGPVNDGEGTFLGITLEPSGSKLMLNFFEAMFEILFDEFFLNNGNGNDREED